MLRQTLCEAVGLRIPQPFIQSRRLTRPLAVASLRFAGADINFMYNNDRNYVSVGGWMLMMLVTAIPVVGQIMVIVWAFAGDNESRKNYFRAILVFFVLFIGLFVFLAMLGSAPAILKQLEALTRKG